MKAFDRITESMLLACSKPTTYDIVHQLNWAHLCMQMGIPEDEDSYYREGTDAFELFDYIRDHFSVMYYARPRESFNKDKAILEALKRGYSFVLLEDMS